MFNKFMKFTIFLKLMLALNASIKEIQTGKLWSCERVYLPPVKNPAAYLMWNQRTKTIQWIKAAKYIYWTPSSSSLPAPFCHNFFQSQAKPGATIPFSLFCSFSSWRKCIHRDHHLYRERSWQAECAQQFPHHAPHWLHLWAMPC